MNEQSTEPSNIPTPGPTADDRGTKQEVKRHRSQPLLVGGLALLIAILGGVATLAVYKNYFEKARPQTTATQPTTVKTVERKNISKELLTSLSSQISAGEVVLDGRSPAYKPSGYDFAVAANDSPSLHFTRSAVDSRTTSATVASFFKSKGYSEKIVVTNAESSYTITEYGSADAKCTVNQSYSNVNDTINPVKSDIVCLDTVEYTSVANDIKPFYVAYSTSASEGPSGTVLIYEPKVTASKTAGYKTAEATIGTYGEMIGSAMGLFYMTPDGTWHFFKATQELPACSLYNTPDLKKAYLGTTCYDIPTNKEAAVKL